MQLGAASGCEPDLTPPLVMVRRSPFDQILRNHRLNGAAGRRLFGKGPFRDLVDRQPIFDLKNGQCAQRHEIDIICLQHAILRRLPEIR